MIQFLRVLGVILALANAQAHSASPLETWVHRYGNVLTNSQDTAVKAILDSRGDLVVVGAITDQSTGSDIIVLKYSAATGSLLWQSRYDGPTHNNDVPLGAAVDTQGNVLVTGASLDEQADPDALTIKYEGTTGILLWDRRLVGAPNTRQELHAIAVDRNDNVLVTGFSVNATYPDIYTAIKRLLNRVGYEVKFFSVPGRRCAVQRAATLTGPWTTLATVTVPTTGLVVYGDFNPISTGAFYRLSTP